VALPAKREAKCSWALSSLTMTTSGRNSSMIASARRPASASCAGSELRFVSMKKERSRMFLAGSACCRASSMSAVQAKSRS
jgi:hypothetical protein